MAEGSSSSGNEGVMNFLKLRNLFGASTSQIYRSHFVDIWNHYFGASLGEWQNTKDFVEKKFISGGIGKEIYDSCDEYDKKIVRTGNISLWNLTLLLDVIRQFQNAVKNLTSDGGIKFLTEEKLDEMKILWEEVDYQSRIIVDYENYGDWMAKVIKALEENGMSKEEIRTTALFLEKPAEGAAELDDVGKLADKLKQDGNLAVGRSEFEKALKFYTEAIELDGLPDELLGTLYSNRSRCNIHLKKLEEAKFDAKCAMTLRPSWFRGYFRLGKIYEKEDEFSKASQFYMFAEVLQPGNKEVEAATKSCKEKRDNTQYTCSNSAGLRNILNMEKRLAYQNPQQVEKHKELLRQGDPFTLCREGELYENGEWGYPQDNKRAAELYSKAASKGYATGIFKLATLIEEGEGVPKDVQKAFEMYKQVASMPPFQDDPNRGNMRMNGIHAAQMKLGEFYEKGEIVPRDLELAISWYKKALENGSDWSAYGLGFIYLSQEKWNIPLAILHFEISSYMGNAMAMGQLANMYLQTDKALAQEWWKLAVHCGHAEMKKEEGRFMTEELSPDFHPLGFRAGLKRYLESSVEFRDLMKEFDDPKYSSVCGRWEAFFHKVDEMPEDVERELCKAMKN